MQGQREAVAEPKVPEGVDTLPIVCSGRCHTENLKT